MNSLVKTVPYQKVYKPKEHGILIYVIRGITSPFLLIAWLILFKEKLDKQKFQIKALEEENNRKNYLLEVKDRECKKYRQQQDEDKTVMEHTKRITQNGNHVKVEEMKTYDGNISNLNKWIGGI